ncbi:hypothetical protein IGI04_008648 [Brassica rapa subsp. trilocularis]|uniref:Uncharacterized protein n=1 Tax=Brassica rapa subsp. trilocularis TaxID=1813537 RepID=A0ABQ7NNA8_BRACM|nr:hypothetical protein IGI04_008648 [Brassica rapa subsp. trilocularis]
MENNGAYKTFSLRRRRRFHRKANLNRFPKIEHCLIQSEPLLATVTKGISGNFTWILSSSRVINEKDPEPSTLILRRGDSQFPTFPFFLFAFRISLSCLSDPTEKFLLFFLILEDGQGRHMGVCQWWEMFIHQVAFMFIVSQAVLKYSCF